MVVNGSKSGKKPLLPFFFELWSNIKKRRKSTRYRAFSAVFIFLEHFLFLEWSTSLVRMRSPVQIRSSAPETSQKWLVFLWFWGGFCKFTLESCIFVDLMDETGGLCQRSVNPCWGKRLENACATGDFRLLPVSTICQFADGFMADRP